MSVDVVVPPVGESISTVVVGQWLVQPGQFVEQDRPVLVLETDKVNLEVPAPVSGVLREILKQSGQQASVGEILGSMEAGSDSAGPTSAYHGPASASASASPTSAAAPAKSTPGSPSASPASAVNADDKVSPAARRLLAENNLDPASVGGSGKHGQILKEDVLRHLKEAPSAPSGSKSAAVSAPGASAAPAAAASVPPVSRAPKPAAPVGARAEEVLPMSPMRATIARRLVEAQQTAALLTTFNEVDMSAVMELRKQYQEGFVARHGVKLGLMSFFIKASIEALKAFPALNAEIRGQDVVYRNYFDIGVAVGSGKGLVVPVLRNAERMSFADVELAIKDFGERARGGRLKLEELQGGTFTISNGGVYGSLLSTPIVNPPQSGVLGLHKIADRPVALNGQVVIRPMMYLAVTYDHRLVDGREAVSFLVRIKDCIENPSRILLEV